MALFNHLGDKVSPEEITDTHFPNGQSRRIIGASDMDGTMFKNDLGYLVFLEKLSDPSFWELDSADFCNLLLPKKYRLLFIDGAGKQIPELRPDLCKLALHLVDDIDKLYELIKSMAQNKNQNRREQKLIREFARKMMELDRIFMMCESGFTSRLKGEILMRTRFFAGKHPKVISKLTKAVMRRSPTSVDRYLRLPIDPENRELAHQYVTAEMIREIHNEAESPFEDVDRAVRPIDDIRSFIRHMVDRRGITGIVATANLKGIAKAAIEHSDDYAYLEEQSFRRNKKNGDRPPLVVGTWLRSAEGGALGARVHGRPVLGERKSAAVEEFAGRIGKKIGIALGDSPSTDGRMLRTALDQGGIAVVVGQGIESTLRRFTGPFKGITEDQQKKIYISAESP